MDDKLPGEGDTKIVRRVRVRRECESCGEPAVYLNTYLMPAARTNPASSAYRRDDCTFCSDHDEYLCGDCQRSAKRTLVPDGYGECSTFSVSARFAHLFLEWKDHEVPSDDERTAA